MKGEHGFDSLLQMGKASVWVRIEIEDFRDDERICLLNHLTLRQLTHPTMSAVLTAYSPAYVHDIILLVKIVRYLLAGQKHTLMPSRKNKSKRVQERVECQSCYHEQFRMFNKPTPTNGTVPLDCPKCGPSKQHKIIS